MNHALNSAAMFWLVTGMLVGMAGTLIFGRWWRAGMLKEHRRAFLVSVAGAFSFAATAILLYVMLGRPEAVVGVSAHGNADAGSSSGTQSIEDSTARLAARLAKDGGSDGDWELLAQSYEFRGRTTDAERARAHSLVASVDSSADPNDFIKIAKLQRQQHNYAAARAAFESAIQRDAMTADSWADYADTLASLESGSKQSSVAAEAIEHALALNPDHAKALWLKASIALDEQRYADALALWKRLRTLVSASETDVRIVDGNIAEAEDLLKQSQGTSAKSRGASSMRQVVIAGTVELDAKFAKRVSPGSTLFIYAKAIDAPGPPLAVLRVPAEKWPVSFRLDDSMAMLPSRNLSSAGDVLIEARISKFGKATPSAGDLQATGARSNARSGKTVSLRIDKEVS